jgi:hypothetical protein
MELPSRRLPDLQDAVARRGGPVCQRTTPAAASGRDLDLFDPTRQRRRSGLVTSPDPAPGCREPVAGNARVSLPPQERTGPEAGQHQPSVSNDEYPPLVLPISGERTQHDRRTLATARERPRISRASTVASRPSSRPSNDNGRSSPARERNSRSAAGRTSPVRPAARMPGDRGLTDDTAFGERHQDRLGPGLHRAAGPHRTTRRIAARGVEAESVHVDHELTGTNRALPRTAGGARRAGSVGCPTQYRTGPAAAR